MEEKIKQLLKVISGAKYAVQYWDEITKRDGVSRELLAQERAQHLAVLREIARAYNEFCKI